MPTIVLSSGHGKKIRGASDWIDEVDEARRVVDRIKTLLPDITTYHDDVSTNQNDNLKRIVDFHNAQGAHDLDVSVHFNATDDTGLTNPIGTEVWYKTQGELASKVSTAMAKASGLKDRGKKQTNNLAFLNNTAAPAILLEVCFVNSKADCELYEDSFDEICEAIATSITGQAVSPAPPGPDEVPDTIPPWEEDEHPTIAKGDKGPAVGQVQTVLGVFPVDGDFGGVTDGAVKGFQAACSLATDGVVGPKTWEALDDLKQRKLAGDPGLSMIQIKKICKLADDSAIAGYNWRDRGMMQLGYIQGVALCFGQAVLRLRHGDPMVQQMARKNTGNASKDALAWYADKFDDLGMDNSKNGVVTLRHLFALMMGLGPRESSGRYCEGRDMSATNTSADEAEAGMFQTSWNIRNGDDYIEPLLEEFWENPHGFLPEFQVGIKLKSDDLGNFGSGDGAKYQFLSKYAPCFHAFVTALGLRSLRQHWGPLNRNEVELREDADELLKQVQAVVNKTEEVA
jgi:hypothetical protein